MPRTVYVLFLFYLQCTLVNKLLMHNAINYLQLPEVGTKWGFLIWLLFSYCGLLCIACMSLGKVSSALLLPVICFWTILSSNWKGTNETYLAMVCFCVQNLFVWLVMFFLFLNNPSTGNFYRILFSFVVSYLGWHCSHRGLFNSLQWLTRRQAHLLRAQQGIPVSEYGVSFTFTQHMLLC